MKFRYARHTNNLEKIVAFYTTILKLEILGEFKNHSEYDGVFLGHKNRDWHLEFTTSNEKAKHTFDEDDLLVFYALNQQEYDSIFVAISTNAIKIIEAKNPYWNENGIMFLDPDGFRIVLAKQF